MQARFFRYLMTRFTEYSELFGPIDVAALAKGEYRRRWSRIVTSEIVFLDEVFKANSAILNALLSLMQERVVYEGGVVVRAKLWTLVGASNEIPAEEELEALYDRFSIRVFEDYLSDPGKALEALEARWIRSQKIEPVATMKDIAVLHTMVLYLLQDPGAGSLLGIGDAFYKAYHRLAYPLVEEMRRKGVSISDRTFIEKLPKLSAAYVVLHGFDPGTVLSSVYDVAPLLARDAAEQRGIEKWLRDSLGELAGIEEKLSLASLHIRNENYSQAAKLLLDIVHAEPSAEIARHQWLLERLNMAKSIAHAWLREVQRRLGNK